MKVTQQVYVAKDWVRSATNSLNAKIQNRHDVEKALGTANHEKTQLAEKLKVAENGRKSAEAGLKSAEAQAEDQCKELYTTQLNLATEKAAVLNLQSKLQRDEVLKVAQEATIAAETSAYERGVLEMETRLTAEVTAICREYCAETYNQALDRAGIPANSNLRRTNQVYYLEDLRENTTTPPPPAALPLPPPNEPLPAQKSSQDTEVPLGAEKRRMGLWWRLGQRRKQRRRGRRRSRIKLMPTPPTPRMPLQLRIWFPKLNLLDPSPRSIPRRILINHRLRYRVLALP